MKKWKIISSKMALDEKWFRVRKDKVRLPSGKIIDDYYLWISPDVCKIVAITKEGKYILEKKYDHGIGEISMNFPAGIIEKGESPLKAAKRELEEETAYISQDIKLIGKLSADITKRTGDFYIFLAQDSRPTGKKSLDVTEEIDILFKSKREVLELIKKGKIQDANTIAAFFLADLKKDTI